MTDDKNNAIDAYDRDAAIHFERFEGFDPRVIHSSLLPFISQKHMKVIDIGAGSGRDADFMQSLGHDVTAVEPANGMHALASAKYPNVSWIKDTLPELNQITDQYDLIFCNNVLMFLSPEDRALSLQRLLEIAAPDALISFGIRLGPVLANVPRFDVDEREFDILGGSATLIEREIKEDAQSREGITFLRLLFRKNS